MKYFFTFVLYASFASAQICKPELRVAVDVGSTTTNVAWGMVKICPFGSGTVTEFVGEPTRKSFSFDFNGKKEISDSEMKKFNEQLTELTKNLPQDVRWNCGATAGVRNLPLKIGDHFLKSIYSAKTRIPCVKLEQDQEGIVGHQGAQANAECKGKVLLMSDVGGGSAQWVYKKNNILHVDQLSFGSYVVKKELAQKASSHPRCVPPDNNNLLVTDTPNPIGKNEVDEKIAAIENLLKKHNTPVLNFNPNICIVGIGKVHAYAVLDQMKALWSKIRTTSDACNDLPQTPPTTSYNKKSLRCLADYLSQFDDCELAKIYKEFDSKEHPGPSSKYSSTNVSNLLFILALMNYHGLNEQTIHVQDTTLAEPLMLVSPDTLVSRGHVDDKKSTRQTPVTSGTDR